MAAKWFALKSEEVVKEIGSDLQHGLASNEISQRLTQYGPNELIDRGTKSPWKILWEQLTGTMVVILIISAVITFFLKEYKDAIAIMVIVILNCILGCTQENQAEKAMAAL